MVAIPGSIPLGEVSTFTATPNGGFPVGSAWDFNCFDCGPGWLNDPDIVNVYSARIGFGTVGNQGYRITTTFQGGATAQGRATVTVNNPTSDAPLPSSLGPIAAPIFNGPTTDEVLFQLAWGTTTCGSEFSGIVREYIERPQYGMAAWGDEVQGSFWLVAPVIVDEKVTPIGTGSTYYPSLPPGPFDDFYQTNELTVYDCCPPQATVITFPRRHFQRVKNADGTWSIVQLAQ
jgi:hypothetical protein